MFETWIASDLRAPVDARRARVLNALTLWFLLGLAGLVIVALTAAEEEGIWVDERLSFAVGGIAAGLALSYILSRRGALCAAVGVFEVVLNVALLTVLGALGSLSPALTFVPLVVLSTAILWSRRAAVWLALAWSVTYLVMALAELGGFEPLLLRDRQAFPVALSISLGLLGFGLGGVLAWLCVASVPRGSVPTPIDKGRPAGEKQQLPPPREKAGPSEGQAEEQQPAVEPREPQPQGRESIPVVPLFRGTVVLPVAGELDAELGEQLLSDLFRGIVEHGAQFVLLDVSHVPVIHQAAARGLARAVAGAGLMGAEIALVGIGPRLAARLVELNVNLRGVTAHVDMEAALHYALHRLSRLPTLRLAASTRTSSAPRQLPPGKDSDDVH
jgi:anti-anti-sigma regulatory factor